MNKHMPPPLKMKVERGRLVPATQYDLERLDSYRVGSTVNVRFTADRIRPLERKYRAILGKVVKECDTPWQNAEAAHQAIKLACGVVNVGRTAGGHFMQWPRSLVDLDDKEMEEFFNDAMLLIQKITGIDPETLKRETAHVADDDIIDPETGEILPTNPGESSRNSSPADDADSAVSSPEPEQPSSSLADGSNEEPADLPHAPDVAAGSSSLSEKELTVLRRFAKDVLNMAANPETSGELMSKVIRRWFNMELANMSEEGKAAAKSIHGSVKAIMAGDVDLGPAIEFHSEMLGCAPEALGG